MPRPIWTGSISFGLVAVPVRMFLATEKKDVRFHEMAKGTGKRVRHRRVAEGSEDEVDRSELVKGYEVEKGKYVELTPEELEAVRPEKSKAIEVEDFVDLEEIDPIYYEKTYYLAPDNQRGGGKPYTLLRKALEKKNKIAIGQFVMRSKQYLAAIRPSGKLLVLETMFYPDEIRSTSDIKPPDAKISDREIQMATQLVDGLSTEWDPKRYRDTYRERVLNLIKRKHQGKEIVAEAEETPEVPSDLMSALQASYEAMKSQRKVGKRKAPAKRASSGRKSSGSTRKRSA
jgi:DNA end-binding protein Ku